MLTIHRNYKQLDGKEGSPTILRSIVVRKEDNSELTIEEASTGARMAIEQLREYHYKDPKIVGNEVRVEVEF